MFLTENGTLTIILFERTVLFTPPYLSQTTPKINLLSLTFPKTRLIKGECSHIFGSLRESLVKIRLTLDNEPLLNWAFFK